jgi:hypothetical protein
MEQTLGLLKRTKSNEEIPALVSASKV